VLRADRHLGRLDLERQLEPPDSCGPERSKVGPARPRSHHTSRAHPDTGEMEQNTEFSDFLRSRRPHLSPEAAGPSGPGPAGCPSWAARRSRSWLGSLSNKYYSPVDSTPPEQQVLTPQRVRATSDLGAQDASVIRWPMRTLWETLCVWMK
jgi:hypothetical protein